MSEQLQQALDSIKGRQMSAEELEAQRVSFVYGNAPSEDQGTKASVRRSLSTAQFA